MSDKRKYIPYKKSILETVFYGCTGPTVHTPYGHAKRKFFRDSATGECVTEVDDK